MNELHAILDAWRHAPASDRDAVLATVVHVTGSAYRRPGARMLILPDGRHIGGISGGCLEGEIVRKAWWFTESETPVLRVYDTSSDDDAVWEFGLGCNGVVHVLLERVSTPGASRLLSFLDSRRATRSACVVVSVVRSSSERLRVGDRLLIDETLSVSGELAGSAAEDSLLTHVADVMARKESRFVHLPDADIFFEFIGPPVSLVVFGAGHDAIPLVNIAAELGWDVTVADGRPAYAKADRFPGARRVVTLNSENLLADIEINKDTAVVVMTHNFPMDVRLFPLIQERQPRYLGLLGSRARAERMFCRLGIERPEGVHGPAGLDIGSETPQAVALSIVAEVQATLSRRGGQPLLFRNAPIHAPATEIGEATVDENDRTRPAYCDTLTGSHV